MDGCACNLLFHQLWEAKLQQTSRVPSRIKHSRWLAQGRAAKQVGMGEETELPNLIVCSAEQIYPVWSFPCLFCQKMCRCSPLHSIGTHAFQGRDSSVGRMLGQRATCNTDLDLIPQCGKGFFLSVFSTGSLRVFVIVQPLWAVTCINIWAHVKTLSSSTGSRTIVWTPGKIAVGMGSVASCGCRSNLNFPQRTRKLKKTKQ